MFTVLRSCSIFVAVAVIAFATSASAQLNGEPDCWVTDPGSSTIEIPALPAGFFGTKSGTPSDPFGPVVIPVGGLPLTPPELGNCGCATPPPTELVWVDTHGTPVAPGDVHAVGQILVPVDLSDTDTCVERLSNATFGGGVGVPEPVDIQLVELSLVSTAPITVTYGAQPSSDFDVFVTEDGPQSQGTLTVTPTVVTPAAGTMTLGGLPVAYQLRFEEVSGPALFSMTGLSITFQGANGTFGPNMLGVPSMSARNLALLIAVLTVATLLFLRLPRRTQAS